MADEVRAASRRPRRPRWVRFAKAASTDLSQIIYETAAKKGLDVSFFIAQGSSTCANSSSWSKPGSTGSRPFDVTGDGSRVQVYGCLKGHLEQLHLSEEEVGVVVMMAYGLLKAPDLEILPTTWRPQLMAALRLALLHGLKPESKATQAVNKLQKIVELWRPLWQKDYDAFRRRGAIGKLLMAALAAANRLTKLPSYLESEHAFDEEPAAIAEAEDDDPEEMASI